MELEIKERVATLEAGQAQIKQMVISNTELTQKTSDNVDEALKRINEVIEAFETLKGGVGVIKVIGNTLKWCSYVIAACIGAYLAVAELFDRLGHR